MKMTVARAAGTGLEMGRAHGAAFADGIARSIRFYEKLTTESAVVQRPLGPFIDATRRARPDLAAEIDGLAEGAGISSEQAWFLNCMEEVMDEEACTTIVHGRWLMHAEQWYAGHSDVGVVLAAPSDGPGFASPTCMGFLPAVGMSTSGFAQGIDSLAAADDRVGVPRVIVSRAALGANGIQAATEAASMPGRAGGYAHTLRSQWRAVVVETSATTETVIPSTVAHTNHYLADKAPAGPRPSAGSLARLDRALTLVEEAPPQTIEDCTALLADHASRPESICLHEDGIEGSATVFGMVCDVASGQMLVSDGAPCEGRWEEFFVPQDERYGVG